MFSVFGRKSSSKFTGNWKLDQLKKLLVKNKIGTDCEDQEFISYLLSLIAGPSQLLLKDFWSKGVCEPKSAANYSYSWLRKQDLFQNLAFSLFPEHFAPKSILLFFIS